MNFELEEMDMKKLGRRSIWLGSGWKMHKTLAEAISYAKSLRMYVETEGTNLHLFVVPPFTVLHAVSQILKGTSIDVGAQNMHWEDSGPFTGEISPTMIKDTGALIIELGHSERRTWFGETDSMVNMKVLAALRHGLRPLICVGEVVNEKESGQSERAVLQQVKNVLKNVPMHLLPSIMIAYEPMWAIGESGTAAKPDYVNNMHQLIRTAVAEFSQDCYAKSLPVLYGGSVNINNAAIFIEQPNIDGLFVGRASLEVDSFIQIMRSIEHKASISTLSPQSDY